MRAAKYPVLSFAPAGERSVIGGKGTQCWAACRASVHVAAMPQLPWVLMYGPHSGALPYGDEAQSDAVGWP